jgi:hypothetical protein
MFLGTKKIVSLSKCLFPLMSKDLASVLLDCIYLSFFALISVCVSVKSDFNSQIMT